MKILLILLLCASIAANAVLYVRTSQANPSGVSNEYLHTSGPPSESAIHANSLASVDPEIVALLAANNPAAIARLRALGFSEKAIRALVEAQIDEEFRTRMSALAAKQRTANFWQRGYGFNPAGNAERTELYRERLAAIRKILGDDYLPDMGRFQERYGSLPPAKVFRLQQIEEDYNAMRMAVQGTPFSMVRFPEDQEKLAYLEKEKRAELSQLLSPDELFEFDLRTSTTAMSLRRQLAAFDPTEQEFRDLFQIKQAADKTLGLSVDDFSRDAMDARQKAQAAFDQQAKNLLGDQRYADYVRANDPDYRRFYQIAARLQLPADTPVEAQALKTSIQQQQSQITHNPAFRDPTVRAQAMATLTQDAEVGFRRILGDEGFEAYRTSPGNLFQRLRPPVRPKG